jgi:hypothetical protein
MFTAESNIHALMAKKGKKPPKKAHELNSKMHELGMAALTALISVIGTETADHFRPPPPVNVFIETQTQPSNSYRQIYPKARKNQQSVDPPEDWYRISISGHEGLKQDFVINTTPQLLALSTLAPIDHRKAPSNPTFAVKTDLWGAPSGYGILADQNHMLKYFSDNFELGPKIRDALSKVTEINITKAEAPGKPAEDNQGAAANAPDKTT